MTLDTVPWMVAGGAKHSAEVGRAIAHASLAGTSGVIKKDDLKVIAQDTAGGSVKVGAGVGVIANTYADQTGQSYVSRNVGSENVNVSPTSGSPRSDMLVLRIDDPEFGGSAPASIADGPYNRFAIISNVGSSAVDLPGGTSYPAIPLARIDIPAGTGAITNAMIKDLRKVAGATRRIIAVPTIAGDVTGPGDAPIIELIGWVSGVTTGSGIIEHDFPTPFPNGILDFHATTTSGSAQNPVINAGALSKTHVGLIWPSSPSTSVKAVYRALGW